MNGDQPNFVFRQGNGPFYGWFTERGLARLDFPKRRRTRFRPVAVSSSPIKDWADILGAALDRYFSGVAEDFSAVPLDLSAGTAFQRAVWETARRIAWGKTWTYGTLAERVGRPKGARAVGQAIGSNPVAIVVPCHRVVAANGALGGFGAGLTWKRRLLGIEGHKADNSTAQKPG